MDFSDSTKILFDRIQRLEPENYIKIIGFLLLQDNSEREMIRLAFGPDNTIQSIINKAKTRLGLSVNSRVEKRPDCLTTIGPRANRRPPAGVCQYFIRGFCKHGSQCRFIHSHTMTGYLDGEDDDDKLSTGSVEKLEREITEMLKLRRGFPISVAALPMLYYETYGKTLTAEGYLTESQRHGNARHSLTRLLARLNSIRIIDRPHGQHAVILAQDIPMYFESTGDINEHGGIVPDSRQIYLTFPAESNFSEQDVSNYFSKFGIVQDVRVPCQQKRMFGFVTFAFAETVRHILSKGNPHFVCGSRVLVKPYREKSMLVDRHMNYADKFQHPMRNDASQFFDAEADLRSMPRYIENSRLISRKQLEEDEQMIEFEIMRISNLNLAGKSLTGNSFFTYKANDFIPSLRGRLDFESNDQFNNLPDSVLEVDRKANTEYNEQQSGEAVNLPDSPFASAIRSGISTAI